MSKLTPDMRAALLLVAALAMAWSAFEPGRSGPFIFDDYWSLRELSQINDDPSWDRHAEYVIDGISSTLGRPLALATFALQHASWPSNPGDFIQVNILLHLLNGTLLFWCLLRLGRLAPHWMSPPLAAVVSALWLLAPLHAGTVLYVVQRMAVLAGTCMLAGLVLYLAGRQVLLRGETRRGYALISSGVFVGTVIGVLAKENATLFPLMLTVCEATLLRAVPRPVAWGRWALAFIAFPTAVVAAYLVAKWPDWVFISANQGHTPWQRLMSEGPVLFMYLKKLFLPSLYNVRLLYDDLPIARSILSSPAVAAAAVAWLAIAAAGLLLRQRAPLLAFGILWFLACHLLESTILPLELAFDHRNYLAAIGPLVALAGYVAALFRLPQAARMRVLVAGIAVLYVAFFAVATWHSANLWGRPLQMWFFWAQEQPHSKRAQHDLADAYLRSGRPDEAARVYAEAWAQWPNDPAFAVGQFELGCYAPELPMPDAARFHASLANFDGSALTTLSRLHRLIELVEMGRCETHSPESLQVITAPLFEIPAFSRQRHNVLLLLSRLARLQGDPPRAIELLEEALAAKPKVDLAIQAAYWSLDADMPERALGHVKWALTNPSVSPLQRWTRRRELKMLQDRAVAALEKPKSP